MTPETDYPPGFFVDPARAARDLKALHETYISSGSLPSVDEFSRALGAALPRAAEPDLALVHMLRFAEVSFNRASLFNDLVRYPAYLELLLLIFGSSRYFADVLVREPELFRWLTSTDVLETALNRAAVADEIQRLSQTFTRPERRLDALKRLYRRQVLRIGAQDLLGVADVTGVTKQLSDLADLLIQAVLELSIVQLAQRFPTPPSSPFAVLGLGKLGGGELNYSSDIDVIFVYGEEGEVADERSRQTSHHEYFNMLAERITRNLAEPTPEGHLYRVDTRLRPEGGAGSLARSLRSTLVYYEARGELWERQMLIKARPVAGDFPFGQDILRQLEPFIYPRTFFQHPAESIARIKARIESSLGDDANIKLRAGGIRDIEFIVQTLQLVNGGKNRKVREANTLRAVTLLAEEGLLSADEAKALTEAYGFYRTLEHRLQIMFNTQTHVVPSEKAGRAAVARRLGLDSASSLEEETGRRLRTVRAIFEQVMAIPVQGDAPGILAVVDGSLEEEASGRVLAGFGIRDARQAAKHVRVLMTGSALTDGREIDTRTRDAFRALAPALFQDIARTADPDMTLRNFALLAAAQRFPGQLYGQLREDHFRKFVLAICAASPRFARGLSRNPLLLEALSSDVRSLADGPILAPPPAAGLAEFKSQQETRAGIRNLLGFASLEELTAELSRLADFVVTSVFEAELRRVRRKKIPVAVFALGKYGTSELGFDSDLDLFCVGKATKSAGQSALEHFSSGIVRRLTEVTEQGSLYAVDARLRPEGRNAPLIVELSAYERYLRERASLWERQSLTRLRFICGDAALGREVEQMVERYVYDTPLPEGWGASIMEMRYKMETRSRTRGAQLLDIKLGAGGMADIEFLAQMLQLAVGGAEPAARHTSVPSILAMRGLRPVEEQESAALRATYLFYREIEKLLRVTLEERGSILPEGDKLALLARCLDRSDAATLYSRVATSMKETRALFMQLARRIEQSRS